MSEIAFDPEVVSSERRFVEFLMRGVTLAEFLESGVLVTASPWIRSYGSEEHPREGIVRGATDAAYRGLRISEAIETARPGDGWQTPTLTELATCAAELGTTGPLIALASYDCGTRNVRWAPCVTGDLITMWPLSTILPANSAVLFVETPIGVLG